LFRNLQSTASTSVFGTAVEGIGNGYLLHHYGLPSGPTKLRTVDSMFFIGQCGNTVNVYDFGCQGGDIAAVNIRDRGVYDFRSYSIVPQGNGIFRPGSFDVRSKTGPSKRQIPEILLANANDQQQPLIQAALNRL
jgi:hypothetical protein